jgi:hypothetical protein
MSDPDLDLSGLTVEGLYEVTVQSAWGLMGALLAHNPPMTIEEIAPVINQPKMRRLRPGEEPPPIPQYWEAFRREFHIFLCTDDKKYAELKRRLATAADKSQTAMVSTISAGVAGSIGLVPALLVPVCAMCLIAVLKMGKEAFCRAQRLDVKLRSDS